MKPDGRPDAVCVVVLRGVGDDARVLLLRRAHGAFAGAWTFVMGGVDGDERATQTARRELREETGIVDPILYTAGELDAFYDPVRDRVVHVPFFVARVDDGAVDPKTSLADGADADAGIAAAVAVDEAHDAHRWVTFAQAAELLEFAAQRRVLDEIHRAFVAREPQRWRRIAEPAAALEPNDATSAPSPRSA